MILMGCFGELCEIVNVVLFLVFDVVSFMIGSILMMDGGYIVF